MASALSRRSNLIFSLKKSSNQPTSATHLSYYSSSSNNSSVDPAIFRTETMTNSEAFVETLVSRGVTDVFGIVGSAFMDSLDLFPAAGIRFISTAHEQGAAHMADGYSRISNRHGVCIGQNGPGISNFVTGIAAAYWAHSPVVCITPEAGSPTKGFGGFQEVDQLPLFEPITKYQAHVNHPSRMAEMTARAFDTAMSERGPTQLNIPRDYFYGENMTTIPPVNAMEMGPGGPKSLQAAAELISQAKRPVILAGGGVTMCRGADQVKDLAEFLGCPVASSYLHNDSFPCDHPLSMGPLGYQGSKAAMAAMQQADLILAIGTRLGPFGTLPQYQMDYWPNDAKVVQIDSNPRNLGLTPKAQGAEVKILGSAGPASEAILSLLRDTLGFSVGQDLKSDRMSSINQWRENWNTELDEMTHGLPHAVEGLMKPREVLRALEKTMPRDAVVSTDIGNINSVANSYLKFTEQGHFLAPMTFGNCGYSLPAAIGAKVASPEKTVISYAGEGAWGMSMVESMTCVREKIPVTSVVFNNGQWGAEKKNQVLWFGDRYVGTQLENQSFAQIARSMGAEGIRVDHIDQVPDALQQGLENQRNGKHTVLEMMVTKELGEPFRRDAMKLPIRTLPKYKHTDLSEESATGQPVDIQK